ncbi:hypothetical protein Lepto7375DRAFT_6787 [Leptolyngbya sp. PCC 7375]|nr:hypothetical protein Lepto7375DRAFT_6787 [Leptolyngbya sp. PCC 7375]
MEQLELDPKPGQLKPCPWARPHRDGVGIGVVLAVPCPLPYGLAPWLRSQGWIMEAACDRNQWAVLVKGPGCERLLHWLKPPAGHGSYTAGNYLPW